MGFKTLKYIFFNLSIIVCFGQNLMAQDTLQSTLKINAIENKLSNTDDYTKKINLLYNIGELLSKEGNSDEAQERYKKILALAQLKKDTLNIVKTTLELANINVKEGKITESINYAKSIEELLSNNLKKYYLYLGKAKNVLIKAYKYTNQTGKALEASLIANELYRKVWRSKEVEGLLRDNYLSIGKIYGSTNNYEQAIESGNMSLELALKSKNNTEIVNNYLFLGEMYYHIDDSDMPFEYYNKALKISEEENDNTLIAHSYTHLGEIYFNKGNYKEAINCHEKALHYEKMIDDSEPIVPYFCLAETYTATDEKMALKYIDSSLALSKKMPIKALRHESLLLKSNLLKKGNKNTLALDYLQQSLEYSKQVNSPNMIMKSYNELYVFYNEMGDSKNGLQYLKKYVSIKDELEEVSKESRLEVLEIAYKYRETDVQLKNKKNELELIPNKQNRFKNNVYFAIIIVGLLLAFALYSVYRKRKLIEVEQVALISQQELLNVKKDSLDREVEFKNKRLIDFSIQINEKNELLKKIKTQLKDVKPINNKSKTILSDAILFISNDIEQNEEKIQLYLSNKASNDDFEVKINENFTDLNEKEVKIVMLIRIGKTSKEISSLLNISVGSVDNYRYSLRKKMDVPKKTSLKVFIDDI